RRGTRCPTGGCRMSSVDRLAQPLPTGRVPAGRTRPRDERPEVSGRRPADLLLTVAVYLAILAAAFPLLRVVRPGYWTLGVVLLPALLLGAGYLARRFRVAAVGVSLIEALLWLVLVTVVFVSDAAFLGVLPVPATVGEAS